MLADRLALAIGKFRELELETCFDGSQEAADYWRDMQRYLVGEHAESFSYLFDSVRGSDDYKLSMARIRMALKNHLQEYRSENAKSSKD